MFTTSYATTTPAVREYQVIQARHLIHLNKCQTTAQRATASAMFHERLADICSRYATTPQDLATAWLEWVERVERARASR